MSLQDGPGLAVVDTAGGTSEQVWTGTSGRLLDKANTDVVERDGTAFVSDYLGDAVGSYPSTSSTSSWARTSSSRAPIATERPPRPGSPRCATRRSCASCLRAEQRRCAQGATTLHDLDRQWLAASPFCLVATSAPDGTCDVSPKGDPPGFAHVIDDRTIAIPSGQATGAATAIATSWATRTSG